jgi:hypothetical protein
LPRRWSLFSKISEENSTVKIFLKFFKKVLYFCFLHVIMTVAFLRGLEKAPTFLVPIINPPFADNSPHLLEARAWIRQPARFPGEERAV